MKEATSQARRACQHQTPIPAEDALLLYALSHGSGILTCLLHEILRVDDGIQQCLFPLSFFPVLGCQGLEYPSTVRESIHVGQDWIIPMSDLALTAILPQGHHIDLFRS